MGHDDVRVAGMRAYPWRHDARSPARALSPLTPSELGFTVFAKRVRDGERPKTKSLLCVLVLPSGPHAVVSKKVHARHMRPQKTLSPPAPGRHE